jgi:long-chain fatty acid transport protein
MARIQGLAKTLALAVCVGAGPSAMAQGLYLSAAGPVNRSMGGASVAAPTDAIGALYWNPASISGMDRSEMAFGLDVLWSQQTVGVSAPPVEGVFPGFDTQTLSSTGTVPVPNISWVYKTAVPEVTLGLGVNTVAGFKTSLPFNPDSAIEFPQVFAQAQFFQIAPIVSYAVNDQLSIAAGPTIVTGTVQVDPFLFAPPNANGSFAPGVASEYEWGGGLQCGVYYILNDSWRFGSSFKSTQWISDFQFNTTDGAGAPRIVTADIDLPMIVSVGTSYSGLENWLFALDARYFDYAGTAGLGDRATIDGAGALGGLDWSSVVAVALGAQRKFGDMFALRGGYTYNQSPIKDSEGLVNLATPLFYEHMLSTGFSITPNRSLSFNAAYSHMFDNTLSSDIVPGITFSNSMHANFLTAGISVFY